MYSVAPRTGAWIETEVHKLRDPEVFVAPRTGAWIETGNTITIPNIF